MNGSGTYALVLRVRTRGLVRIGALGRLRLAPGRYVYVGSAFGPGGVRARVARHLRAAPRPHWHIDYLRTRAAIREVWYTCDPRRLEHRWAALAEAAPGSSIPLPRLRRIARAPRISTTSRARPGSPRCAATCTTRSASPA